MAPFYSTTSTYKEMEEQAKYTKTFKPGELAPEVFAGYWIKTLGDMLAEDEYGILITQVKAKDMLADFQRVAAALSATPTPEPSYAEEGYTTIWQMVGTDPACRGDAYQAVTRLQQEGGWIAVEDRLPDSHTQVLVFHSGEVSVAALQWEYPGVEEDFKAFQYWENDGNDMEWANITHWQPLPTAPTTQTKEGGQGE